MSVTSTHSLTVWIWRMPQPRLATSTPRPLNTLASEAAPVARVLKGLISRSAAPPHGRDRLRRHLHRADRLLRRQPRVGLEAVHGELHPVGGRRARDQLVHAVAVEDQSSARAQAPDVEVLGPEQTHLLADREEHVDRPVRDPALVQQTHRLEDGDDARLVVAAEHRGAIGADDVAVDDAPDVAGRRHGVHVAAQEQRSDVRCRAGKTREQVAGVAADLVSRVVDLHGRSHTLEDRGQTLGDVAFALGHAGDAHQLEELVAEAIAAHARNRLSQATLAVTASARWAGSVRRWSPPGITSRSQGSSAWSCSCTPWSSVTTSSASPWTTRWRATFFGASA